MSKSKNNKMNAIIGVGILLALTAGVGTFTIINSHHPDTPTLDEQMKKTMAKKVLAFTDNGVIKLYDSTNGHVLDTFDLKKLSTGKERVIEVVKPQVVTPKPQSISYKDFLQIPITIQSGESVWAIQESLTPSRDTSTMLNYLKEINKDKSLHPVHSGEQRIFLKEKGDKGVDEVETLKPEPVVTTEKKIVKKVDNHAVYLYSKSEDFQTLYAYNDIEQTFYRVSVKDDQIEAKPMMTLPDMEGVKDFKVVKGILYVVFNNGTKVREIPLSDHTKVREYPLKGIADIFAVRDGFLFYTYEDHLGKINLSNGEETDVLLGDKSTDFVFTKDKLYVLNTFGSKVNNSILMKINPSDLKVDDLIELKSNENLILSEGKDSEDIYVAQMRKLKDLNKEIHKTSVVLPIHSNNLEKDLLLKIPFDKKAMELNECIYEIKDETLKVYSATNGKVLSKWEVGKATQAMPLP